MIDLRNITKIVNIYESDPMIVLKGIIKILQTNEGTELYLMITDMIQQENMNFKKKFWQFITIFPNLWTPSKKYINSAELLPDVNFLLLKYKRNDYKLKENVEIRKFFLKY